MEFFAAGIVRQPDFAGNAAACREDFHQQRHVAAGADFLPLGIGGVLDSIVRQQGALQPDTEAQRPPFR